MTLSYPPRQAKQLVAPASEPLTLAEIKLFLRIDASTEDSLLNHLALAARELVEQYLGKLLITQSWQLQQHYTGQPIRISPGPVQSITQVKIVLSGVQITLESGAYEYDETARTLTILTSPRADQLLIDYVAGYGTADDVPGSIKQAILQAISHLYHHRDHPVELGSLATQLLAAYKEIRL